MEKEYALDVLNKIKKLMREDFAYKVELKPDESKLVLDALYHNCSNKHYDTMSRFVSRVYCSVLKDLGYTIYHTLQDGLGFTNDKLH
jgi:hypothetical protein